jgi:apolipoprotein N-acyltransferase
MSGTRITDEVAQTTTGIAGVIAATGVIIFALFPLALPIVLLTTVVMAPLLLAGAALGLPVALVAAAVLAIRAIARRARRRKTGWVTRTRAA